jgi:hypothetical protein
VLHGFPFAIAGVACAFGVANVSSADVKKTNVTAPTKPLMIAHAVDVVNLVLQAGRQETLCINLFE